MKKPIAIAIIMLLLSAISMEAQYYAVENREKVSLEVRTMATQSIHGQKVGLGFNLNINNRWQLGYFSLNEMANAEAQQSTFEGAQLAYNLFPQAKFSVMTVLKVGYYDKTFLSVLPSLQANYALTKKINLSIGGAYSDGYPYFNGEVGYKIFRR